MIEVTIYKNKHGNIQGYKVSGHAGYDSHGKDIVCAGVSVLAQTALISLVEVCNVDEEDLDYFIDDDKGILEVKVPKDLPLSVVEKADTVFKTFEVGIKAVVESYSAHVSLRYKEV
ncbi:MAG: ribosomal-processing cysteine protease Prp [Tissierellia bacterium]|nr:ribosomal-processing cysteine protease Prp [Tissierellia bacterium]